MSKNTSPKVYDPTEEKINIYTHLIGGVLSLFGIAGIFLLNPPKTLLQSAAVIVYGISLVFMYMSSAFYHSRKNPSPARAWGRRMDHCAIFFLIAGTYTAVTLLYKDSTLAIKCLPVIWNCAFAGIVMNLFFFGKWQWLSILLYLVMGWFIILYIGELISGMPGISLFMLVLGGCAYTTGVIFYLLRIRFSHALWHFFVLTGTTLHFFAIASMN